MRHINEFTKTKEQVEEDVTLSPLELELLDALVEGDVHIVGDLVVADDELIDLEGLDEEQIDELSRKTLGSYINKARPDGAKHAHKYFKGTRRGSKAEAEADRKMTNRDIGTRRAVGRLAKMGEDELPEDNETIDELSRKTLGRYINKARENEKVHRSEGDYHADEARRSINGKNTDRHMKIAGVRWGLEKRRDKGIKTAVNKLTKEDELTDEDLDWIVENITEEDFEQLDELSRYTLLNYAKKAHNDETEHGYESDRADLVAKNVPKHSRQMWHDKAEWHAQKHDKRSGGVNLALKKALRKEDELPEDDETIDESAFPFSAAKPAISKGVMHQFMKRKAAPAKPAKTEQADDASRYADKHAAKRDKGIKTAVKKLTKEEDEMIDETAALDSLQPGSHTPTDPKSKLEYLNGMIGMMASMQSHELEKFWGDAVALVGKEADKVPAGAAGNQASINAKPSNALGGGAVGQEGAHAMVDIHDPLASGAGAALGHGPSVGEAMKRIQREDLSAMLDGEQLSEEFKDKAATLFEAAVGSRLSIELAAMKDGYAKIVEDLETEHEEVLAEEIEKVAEQITEGVESYLDYVSERWLTENELAVESQLRNEIAADFMVGLRNLLDEHWIDVPDGPEDVLASVLEDFESLRTEYNKTLDENMRLSAFLAEKARDEMVDEATSGLSETQKAKFRSLCENVEADDADEFQRKLETIKEAHFLKGAHKKPSNILTEAFDGAEVKIHDPAMKAYSETITRNFKTI